METSTYDELEVSVVLVSELVDVVVALFNPEPPVLEVASDVLLVAERSHDNGVVERA